MLSLLSVQPKYWNLNIILMTFLFTALHFLCPLDTGDWYLKIFKISPTFYRDFPMQGSAFRANINTYQFPFLTSHVWSSIAKSKVKYDNFTKESLSCQRNHFCNRLVINKSFCHGQMSKRWITVCSFGWFGHKIWIKLSFWLSAWYVIFK